MLTRALIVAIALVALAPARALADTTIDFEQYPPQTVLTNQYADTGGSGQGVVFGPLPGNAGDGLRPVIEAVSSGIAQSGSQVASIATCSGCEFFQPTATATFSVPRSRVSLDAGYLGTPSACTPSDPNAIGCAQLTLTAYDAGGQQVATSTASLTEGSGIHTPLSVSTPSPTIVGFRLAARDTTDDNKQIAIDDLSFDTPAAPAAPDFSLMPATTDISLVQGESIADPIAIDRIGGSTGNIAPGIGGLPAGVSGTFAPNPTGVASSTLTLTADPNAPPTGDANPLATVTGTPATAAVGQAQRSFGLHVRVQPAFAVAIPPPRSVSLSACSAQIPVQVTRDLRFPGPVSVSVSGLPPGVQASFAPAQATFPNGAAAQTLTLSLTAPPTGQPLFAASVTVHATAPPLAESTATFTTTGTCPKQFDPEIVSMQITQGTQLPVLPRRDPTDPGAPIPYGTIGRQAAPGTQQALAKLAASKPTVVRVYADLRYGPDTGLQVPAELEGWRYNGVNRVPLPGSPILPVAGPAKLYPGPSLFADDFLQDNYTGVYTFALPASWEAGGVELQADLLPAQTGRSGPVAELAGSARPALAGLGTAWAPCLTPVCQIDGRFAISDIPFLDVSGVPIRPLAMIVTDPYDATLPDPETAFKWARVVTPIPLTIEPYAETIDSGDLSGDGGTDAALGALSKVEHYVCYHGGPDQGFDFGVLHNDVRSAEVDFWCFSPDSFAQKYAAFGNAPEPLTSMAHELFHLLGRPHASAGCGAGIGLGGNGTQGTETWPPDQHGWLQSVGLAPAPADYGFPYEVIPISPDTSTGQWFDFMSYCQEVSDGNPLDGNHDAWVSVHNWNAVLSNHDGAAHDLRAVAAAASPSEHSVPSPADRAGAKAAPSREHSIPSLAVSAFVDGAGQVTIADVTPVNAPPMPASSSAYQLLTSGRHHVEVAMREGFGHIDEPRSAQPIELLDAVVPAAGVHGLSVLHAGATVATLEQSSQAPSVRVPGIPRLHAGRAIVRWRTVDRDRKAFTAEVDYSGDGGRSWKAVWTGPNRGRALFPARDLYRSARARIRVIVSDGFRTASAVSRRFRSPGTPPTVQILAPWPGLHQPNDAPLILSGQAFDDQSHSLTGRRLRWMLGRRLLGTGAQVTVTGLPAGRRHITLLATDRAGRTGRAPLTVQLRAQRPLFLALHSPRSVKPTARRLRLAVASSLPSKLLVAGRALPRQRFAVGRRTRRMRVRLRPGRSRLALTLTLRAGGLDRVARVAIRR